MKLRRNRNNVPGLNTTSTADISFMLLVFFLVTSSMFVDKGLQRQLPPKDKDEEKEVSIERENILALRLSAEGELTVNDSLVRPCDLKPILAEFIKSRGREHVLMIDADDDCHYEAYFRVQNAMGEAYKEVRETMAQARFGRSFDQLTSIDREALLNDFPQRVAENLHDKQPQGGQGGSE